jgi:hypothetical protein
MPSVCRAKVNNLVTNTKIVWNEILRALIGQFTTD